jgi:hypothetical protein
VDISTNDREAGWKSLNLLEDMLQLSLEAEIEISN